MKRFAYASLLPIMFAIAMASMVFGQVSGTKSVGPTGNYATLTAALTDISTNGLSGHVILELQSTYTSAGETFPLLFDGLGTNSTQTLTVRPTAAATGLTISGSGFHLIVLQNISYVTIDGRPGGIGTNRELTIENTTTSYSLTVEIGQLGIPSDVSNITVTHCIINSSSTSGSAVWFGGCVAAGSNNNTISHNIIRRAIGAGNYGPVTNKNVSILNNEILDFGYDGINIGNGMENMTISGNTIHSSPSFSNSNAGGIYFSGIGTNLISENIIYGLKSSTYAAYGIALGDARGTTVSRNRIYDIETADGSASDLNGIVVFGQSGQPVDVTIVNNQISLVPSNSNNQEVKGINDYGYAGNTVRAYYNSVYIGGTASGNKNSWAFHSESFSGSTVIARNNIFFNNRTGGTGNHFGGGNGSTATGSLTVDHNLYVGAGATANQFMEENGTAETFSAWKTSNSELNSYGEQASNVSGTSLFTSVATGNLNINSANSESWFASGRGIAGPLSGSIAIDIAGDARSTTAGTPTDIGSDEFTTPTVDPPAATMSGTIVNGGTTTFSSSGRTVGQITWHGSGATTTPTSLPTSVTFKYFPGKLPPPFTSSLPNFINSYWEITTPDGSGFTYDLTLNYTVAEINGITELNLGVAKRDGGNPWIHQSGGVANNTTKTVFIGGLTSFSQFTLDDNNSPLPIQLASFTATEIPNSGVLLRWTTLSEINNYGFYVQRKLHNETAWTEIPRSFIAGHGTTNEPHSYQFPDLLVTRGSWSYRLKQVDLDNTIHYTEAIQVNVLTSVKEVVPNVFSLQQNYPNPFNPTTEIKFSVEKTERATLEVFNLLGEKVATLFDDIAEPGQYYRVKFDAKNLASGVYLYRLQSGKRSELKKLLQLK